MLSEAEKKFKECVITACETEHAKREKEGMEAGGHHEFSRSFENRMDEVMRIYRRRKLMDKLKRYGAVAAAVVVVAAGGVFLTSTKSTEATTPGVNVLEWLKDYFSFEKGSSGKKAEDVLFSEEQIGFIPEGFELVGEVVDSETAVKYEYMNKNDFFTLRVAIVKISLQQNSEGIENEVKINQAGYEYTYVYEEENQCHTFFWKDDNDLFYNLTGNLNIELMRRIMDGIDYER